MYAVPAVALGVAVGRLWALAIPAASWCVLYLSLLALGAPRGDAAGTVYLALGVSGVAGAAIGVGVRTLADML